LTALGGLAFAGAGTGTRAQSTDSEPASTLGIFTTAPQRDNLPEWTGDRTESITAVGKNRFVINKSGAQSETAIAIDPTNPLHVLAMANDLATGATAELYESFDNGKTWVNAGLSLSPTFCYDPWIDFNAAGDAFVSYECSDQRIGYRKVGQTTWTKTTLGTAGFSPDRDMVVVDTTPTSPFFNSVYIGYDDNGANNAAYLMRSVDGFGGWLRTPKINDASTTIGVNAATAPDGTVYATWLDYSGRKVMVDRSTNGGATWGTDHVVHNYRLNTAPFFISIPPQPQRGIVPWPMTDVAPAGTAFAGRLYVTYTDIGTSGSNTNVYVRFSDDGGLTWSSEAKVNDDTVNSYHFHPAITVAPNGTVGVSFYDTRNDQPANRKTNQYISYSTDGGVNWTLNQRVSTGLSDESGAGNSNDYGDYQGIDSSSTSTFIQVWCDSRPGTMTEDVAAAISKP
jgi:hypothetical protein